MGSGEAVFRRFDLSAHAPGNEQLLPRAGYACAFGLTSSRFLVPTRQILAVTRRGQTKY
jgi:hypothetical protein